MPSLPLFFFNGFYSCEITPVSSHVVTILSVVDKGLELVHVLNDTWTILIGTLFTCTDYRSIVHVMH